MNDELFAETFEAVSPPRLLPRPTHERWKPLRSGVLNIFKYDEEEFWFEDGRLLLRGNNGAGKSRILALQLPFLLDGRLDSHRVEPDGDPAKRMEWNLLMNQHEQRLGYTWIEFGRKDADGVEHFLTLGCGMHARKGTTIQPNARWFFTTTRRVGETLSLMAENRVPLNRERLGVALGHEGAVYRSGHEYRAAVDGALFGLGARYGPLIDLLLQLRKPQIMRDFKEDDLSRLLSEALPPLSERLIEGVSVSFRSLESDRQQLAELTEARRSVATFLGNYQRYVRIAVRRRASDVRVAHSRYEKAQRDLNNLTEQREENTATLLAAESEKARIEEGLVTGRSAEQTLLDSPEMKSAGDLRRAQEVRDASSKRATDFETLATTSEERHGRMHDEFKDSEAQAEKAGMEAAEHRVALVAACDGAALSGAPILAPEAVDAVAQKGFEAMVKNREHGIALVREKNSLVERATGNRKEHEARFEQRAGDVSRCQETELAAQSAREAALETLVTAIYEWETSLAVLPVTKGDDWRILLENWLEDQETPMPLSARIDAAFQSAVQELSGLRSQCESTLAQRNAERKELSEERETLRSLRKAGDAPFRPPTRAACAIHSGQGSANQQAWGSIVEAMRLSR
jgi:hypothetical protein